MTDSASLTDDTLDHLFRSSEGSQRIAYLEAVDLLNPNGLSALLDRAMIYARADPARARQLAEICAEAAEAAGAPSIIPRAIYTRAQTHAINGELELALDLIRFARREYEALDDELSAIRTNLGKIHVLNELGRYDEALEAGEETLRIVSALDGADPQVGMIAALANMNVGVCYETLGRYDQALDAYDQAEARFEALGIPDRLGDVRNNRGIVLVHLGKVREALTAFEAALAVWVAEDLTLLQAQTLSNIGEAHLALGDFTRGLNAYEAARERFETLDAGAEHSVLLRKSADAYLALNLHPEAISTYRGAVEMLEGSGMVDQRGRALLGLGAALTAQGNLEEAGDRLERAAELFQRAENVPMLVAVMLELSSLRAVRGDGKGARAAAVRALGMIDPESWPVEYLYANLRLSDLHLPDLEAAERHLSDARRVSELFNLPVIRYRLNSRLGHIRKLQGRRRESETLLRSALADIENLRGRLAHEAIRTSFLADKTGVYEELIELYLVGGDRDRIRKAFEISERAKSRTLADLMAGAVARKSAETETDGPAARIRALQAELGAIYNRYFATESGPPERWAALNRQVTELEGEISRLRLQTAGRQTAGFPVALGEPDDLAGSGPLLVYHLINNEILAFRIDGERIRLVRGFAPVGEVVGLLQRLAAQWERFKAGEAFVRRNLPALRGSANRLLEDLYRACFAPVEDFLPEGGGMTIVPHGPLHQVPFHALFDGERYLADRFEIAYAPSATVSAICARRPKTPARRALVAGLADSLVPLVEGEARRVAEQLDGAGIAAELLIGPNANAARVGAAAGGADLIHLACHGLFRSDNPLFSALKLADGWLTGVDVMELDLRPALVVLSACESGRSRIVRGEEAVGLPRAFLGAGAAAVLVSLWLVHDDAAAALMSTWYRKLGEGADRAAALAEAQQVLRETHPHPYYWAPFVLIGQR
ncbi:MAG TPA: CHAT domain-containing tetratricopeptide repeat protein [Anaerolineales bacterium]|nr:CHAT domain-containing tetratricopeptide repeat protein [Anaerolineales bacterium]